jgi:hemolysin activation/secretion protein
VLTATGYDGRRRPCGGWLWLAAAGAVLLAAIPPIQAQTPPTKLPGSVEPGRREAPAPEPAAPPDLQWIIDLPPGVEPPESLAGEILRLEDLEFLGVTAYTRGDLLPLFEASLGRGITLREFYGISQAVQARYHQDGYLLSFTYVPPQAVSDGVFTIAVVEGYVDRVAVLDVEGRLKTTLARLLAPISESRPLRADTLERYMLLANDLSGIRLTGVLQPSVAAHGATELVVKVDHTPLDAAAEINNRGSEFTGPWQAQAGFTLNSLMGLGESFSADATVTADPAELATLDLNYIHPLGAEGLRFNGSVGYSKSEPGFTLEPFDVETDSLNITMGLSYPLVRSRKRNLTLHGEFGYLNTEVDLLGAEFNRDRLRTALAGLSYRQADFLNGTLNITGQVIQGLPILGATDPDQDATSRADAEPTYTKAVIDVVHSQALAERVALTVSVNAQYAFAPLPAAEEFALGGERFGRAYNPGEITGEHGIAVSAELGYDLPVEIEYVERVRPYLFYDFGKAWDQDTASSDGLVQSLSSAGLGLRASNFPTVPMPTSNMPIR